MPDHAAPSLQYRFSLPPELFRAIDRFETSPAALRWIFVAFIALRAAAILFAVTPSSDAEWYYSHAAMLARGQGYVDDHGTPTAYWPPGWPLALGLAFRLNGISIVTVGMFNLIVATIGAWLTLDLGRRIAGSELGARIALLILTVYPNSILYVPLALTEVFYTTLLLAAAWLMLVRRAWPGLAAAGLVFGVATLVKAQTWIVVPMICAIMVWREQDWRRRIPRLAGEGVLVIALTAAVVAPWTVRNHRELGEWGAVSTNGGATLLTGNNDSARGDYTPDDPLVTALYARRGLGEVARDTEARRLAIAWIGSHPARFALLMPMKLVRLWWPDGEALWAYETGSPTFARLPLAFIALRVANQLWYLALIAGFLIAPWRIMRLRRNHDPDRVPRWLLPYAIAFYTSLFALVFSGQSRFHYPVMPFVCMTVGWLITNLLIEAGLPDHGAARPRTACACDQATRRAK